MTTWSHLARVGVSHPGCGVAKVGIAGFWVEISVVERWGREEGLPYR